MDAQLLHQGIAAAIQLSSAANQYVDARAPWSQAKEPDLSGELDITLASLARAVAALCALLSPFLPLKMADLAGRLGLEAIPALDEVTAVELTGRTVRRGDVLFPKPKPA
jgi:methionyl-tRNA synthetase